MAALLLPFCRTETCACRCECHCAGAQVAAALQALGRQLAVVMLLALTCGLQVMAVIAPPAADSQEIAAIVWCISHSWNSPHTLPELMIACPLCLHQSS